MGAPSVVTVLKEEVGESLRAVLFINDGYIPVYRRDDVDQEYLERELDEIHDEFRASSLASPYLSNTWRLGEHRCTIYAFSRGLVCHTISEDDELVVSVDNDPDIDLMAVIDTCSRLLSEE